MKKAIISLVYLLLKLLKPEQLRSFTAMIINEVRTKVKNSEPDWDDKLFLPLCDLIQQAFNLPDNE